MPTACSRPRGSGGRPTTELVRVGHPAVTGYAFTGPPRVADR